jgi:hypothetical protein
MNEEFPLANIRIRKEVPTTELYFECHITIEPVFDQRLELFHGMSKRHGFHVAELLMQKRFQDTPQRSKLDSFATGRSKDYNDLFARMEELIGSLQANEFEVWRYKIENTLIDSKYGDDTVRLDV